MPNVDLNTGERAVAQVFIAHGVPVADSELVARELVRAEVMGIPSHGLVRVMQYVTDIRSGRVKPGAPIEVTTGDGPLAVLDCGWNLGIVAAHKALDIAIERSQPHGIAAVVTQNCNHVGRLGSYAERAARAGLVCIATVAIPELGHFVVPWGGAEGRLGTNPFSFGFPTTADPIVADFATSVIPEGKIRTARMNQLTLPADAVLDADGHPTTDPEKFYGPPRGTLLPFGGPVGYKGYALGLLAELLGGVLSGGEVEASDRQINGLFLLILDPKALAPQGSAEGLADKVVDYMHSARSAPGYGDVLVPGELEFQTETKRSSTGVVAVDDGVWVALRETAAEVGVVFGPPSGGGHA